MANQLTYKGRTIQIDYNPRVGVCNLCGAVSPFDCKRTYMHHETYHDNNPIKDAIEVCTSCHKKIHAAGLKHSQLRHNQGLQRDSYIRVRKWTKEKLKTLGTSGNDNDDVISMLIEFWEKHH